mgnify:CR=1 FL=1
MSEREPIEQVCTALDREGAWRGSLRLSQRAVCLKVGEAERWHTADRIVCRVSSVLRWR